LGGAVDVLCSSFILFYRVKDGVVSLSLLLPFEWLNPGVVLYAVNWRCTYGNLIDARPARSGPAALFGQSIRFQENHYTSSTIRLYPLLF